jgi:DNA (cytosine-5)-methyltransferase 1
MKHLGDITKISGYDAPIVDIICGGSPCQDLSIAGKRQDLTENVVACLWNK